MTTATRAGDEHAIGVAKANVASGQAEIQKIRGEVKQILKARDPKLETKDSDYDFISFVLHYLPHGLIGLLVAVIFCAATSSTATQAGSRRTRP